MAFVCCVYCVASYFFGLGERYGVLPSENRACQTYIFASKMKTDLYVTARFKIHIFCDTKTLKSFLLLV